MGTSLLRFVGGNRLAQAETFRRNLFLRHISIDQKGGYRLRPATRKCHIVVGTTDPVRMAGNFDRIIVFGEEVRQPVQFREGSRLDLRLIVFEKKVVQGNGDLLFREFTDLGSPYVGQLVPGCVGQAKVDVPGNRIEPI